MSSKRKRKPRILSPKNMDVLYDICRFQLLDTDQIHNLHFAATGVRKTATATRLTGLEKAGFLRHTKSYARTTRMGDAVKSRRPRKVMLFPPPCQRKLRTTLADLGRASEFDRFEDYTKSFNAKQSFSDSNLPHELGLNDVLMAAEMAARDNRLISDCHWVRTSPQHPLTSAKVFYKGSSNRTRKKTINPDAIFMFRTADSKAWYFFYVEYDNNTEDAYKYRDSKLVPYWSYFEQGRDVSLRHKGTRYFREVATELNAMLGLGLTEPSAAVFRVLTVSSDLQQAHKLFAASTAIDIDSFFLFTDQESFCKNPFGDIWMRRREFSITMEEEGGDLIPHSLLDRYRTLHRSGARPSVIRKWLGDTMTNALPRVSIP